MLYQQGKVNQALENWQTAENIYQQLKQNEGVFHNQINQIKALQSLGNYQQAVVLVSEVQKKLDQAPLSQQVLGFKNLGEVLQSIGELNQAEKVLLKSRKLATENNLQKSVNPINLSLANNYWALGRLESERDIYNVQNNIANQQSDNIIPWECNSKYLSNKAKEYYQEAEKLYQLIIDDNDNLSKSEKVTINLVNLLIEKGEFTQAKTILSTVNLNRLPPSQTNIYAKINLARHLSCLAENDRSETILTQTLNEAKELQDNKALSYAYGNLGGFYEYLSLEKDSNNQLLGKAKNLTAQALFYAQPSNFPDIAYQWQWQLGRIESRLGNQEEALSHYRHAVESLNQVRRDLVGITADVQFSFRDNVEPVYRQLVRLLLTTGERNPSQATLVSSIGLIDSLQLAELENFLNCDLGVTAQITNLEEFNNSVFIYPIILSDRLDVIYQIPNQPLQYHSQPVNRIQVEATVEKIRKAIARRNPEVLRENAGNLYQWLIEP